MSRSSSSRANCGVAGLVMVGLLGARVVVGVLAAGPPVGWAWCPPGRIQGVRFCSDAARGRRGGYAGRAVGYKSDRPTTPSEVDAAMVNLVDLLEQNERRLGGGLSLITERATPVGEVVDLVRRSVHLARGLVRREPRIYDVLGPAGDHERLGVPSAARRLEHALERGLGPVERALREGGVDGGGGGAHGVLLGD